LRREIFLEKKDGGCRPQPETAVRITQNSRSPKVVHDSNGQHLAPRGVAEKAPAPVREGWWMTLIPLWTWSVGELLMRRRVSKRTALALVLAVITMTSSVLAVPTTTNYFQFFNSLAQIQLNITSFHYRTITNPSEAIANISFTILNPTEYRGITMQLFEPIVIVLASNQTVTSPLGLSLAQQRSPLDPGKNVPFAFPFNSTWSQSWQNTEFVFTIQLGLSTFLDQAASIVATYQCVSNGTPVACEQAAVSIQGTASPGGGRAGGV